MPVAIGHRSAGGHSCHSRPGASVGKLDAAIHNLQSHKVRPSSHVGAKVVDEQSVSLGRGKDHGDVVGRCVQGREGHVR